MARKRSDGPTDAELSILQVLWDHDACTVREVLEHLQGVREIGYTTVLKLLQIMTEKQLVECDRSQHRHVFRALRNRDSTQRHLLRDLLDKAFSGSAQQLILQALSEKPASEAELEQIESMVRQLREERNRD